MTGRFQAGIGALIRRADTGQYFLLQRASHRDFGAGSWECVTGRLEQGEGFEAALLREVQEELSIQVEIDFIAGTSHFHRGDPIPENELLSVLYCCTVNEPDSIVVSDEHSTSKWVTASEAYDFLPSDHWLYRLIQRAEMIYEHQSPILRDFFRQNGYKS